jgi:hypothetical protein
MITFIIPERWGNDGSHTSIFITRDFWNSYLPFRESKARSLQKDTGPAQQGFRFYESGKLLPR